MLPMPSRPLILLSMLTLACEPSEPVLVGIPENPLLSANPTDGTSPGANAGQTDEPVPYQRAENVWVDVRYLGGNEFEQIRSEVTAQLGELLGVRELDPDEGQ